MSTPAGRSEYLSLAGAGPELSAPLQPGPERTVRALEVFESSAHLMHRQHGIGEGSKDRKLASGDLRLTAPRVDGKPTDWSWAGWNSKQAEVREANAVLQFHYQLDRERVVIAPDAAADPAGLRVAVDPDTAARAGSRGSFALSVNGVGVPAAIVAVLPHLPTAGDSFVLADREVVTALLNRTAPGTAPVSQVWLAVPDSSLPAVRQVLDDSPATSATLRYRSDVARAIAEDPVAARSLTLLGAAGSIALMLAMVATAAAVRADAEETEADQYALELDGTPPDRLRALLRWRTGLAVLLGVPIGVLGGLVVTAVAVQIMVVGPGGGPVQPGLRVVLGSSTILTVIVAAVLGGLLATVAASATVYRQPLPEPAEVELR